MDIESFRQYCLQLKRVEETLPFGPDTLVYKVMGKAFALTGLDDVEFKVNLKCNPDWAIELRDTYPDSIFPGWHMNKKHWNTVCFERGLSRAFLLRLVDHSYQLVMDGLPNKVRNEFEALDG